MTPDLITSEMVEKARLALDSARLFSRRNKALNPPRIEICRYGEEGEPEIVVIHTADWTSDEGIVLSIAVSRYRARRVLAVIVEECAKVADAYMRQNGEEGLATYASLSAAIATAIRSLSPPTTKERT